MQKLEPKQVKAIRNLLGLSREKLAAQLDVSLDTVKAWEDDSGSKKEKLCGGPARILLLLMEQSPNILDLLNSPTDRLPHADAVEDSKEWFRLQRLLGILENGGGEGMEYWSGIFVEEKLNKEWLWDMEKAGLLSRHKRNPQIRFTSQVGYKKFHLKAWHKWIKQKGWKDTAEYQPMTPSDLESLLKHS